MCSLLKISIPDRQDVSWFDPIALLQVSGDILNQLMLECELALACFKDESRRRRERSTSPPSQYLWKTFQSYRSVLHKPPGVAPPKAPLDYRHTQKQHLLWLLSKLSCDSCAQRLSDVPKSTLGHLSPLDKATIIQLSLGPWSVEPASDLTSINTVRPSKFLREPLVAFTRLGRDAQHLVKLMTFAGGILPKVFLWDACQSKMWGRDGNVRLLKPALTGCLEDVQRCEAAVRQLLAAGAIHANSNNGQDVFTVDPVFVSHVTKIEPSGSRERIQILTAIFYAFPKDSHLDPI